MDDLNKMLEFCLIRNYERKWKKLVSIEDFKRFGITLFESLKYDTTFNSFDIIELINDYDLRREFSDFINEQISTLEDDNEYIVHVLSYAYVDDEDDEFFDDGENGFFQEIYSGIIIDTLLYLYIYQNGLSATDKVNFKNIFYFINKDKKNEKKFMEKLDEIIDKL